MQSSRALYSVVNVDTIFEHMAQKHYPDVAKIDGGTWKESLRRIRMKAPGAINMLPLLMAVYTRSGVGERNFTKDRTWQETIKSEMGPMYTWHVKNFYNTRNIEEGEIWFSIEQLNVTYKIGDYCFYSDDYFRYNVPEWAQPEMEASTCPYTEYHKVIGWCNFSLAPNRENEMGTLVQQMARSTWGPLFFLSAKGWMKMEILVETNTDFKIRWEYDKEKQLGKGIISAEHVPKKILSIELADSQNLCPLATIHQHVVGSNLESIKVDPFGYSNKIFVDLLKTLHNNTADPMERLPSFSPPDKIQQIELRMQIWILRQLKKRHLSLFCNPVVEKKPETSH